MGWGGAKGGVGGGSGIKCGLQRLPPPPTSPPPTPTHTPLSPLQRLLHGALGVQRTCPPPPTHTHPHTPLTAPASPAQCTGGPVPEPGSAQSSWAPHHAVPAQLHGWGGGVGGRVGGVGVLSQRPSATRAEAPPPFSTPPKHPERYSPMPSCASSRPISSRSSVDLPAPAEAGRAGGGGGGGGGACVGVMMHSDTRAAL